MYYVELYRNWAEGGIVMGCVGVSGTSVYKHQHELGLMAIEELEQEVARLKGELQRRPARRYFVIPKTDELSATSSGAAAGEG